MYLPYVDKKNRGIKAIEVALDHALKRLNQLQGDDRIAFANEYKEWLADDEILTESYSII